MIRNTFFSPSYLKVSRVTFKEADATADNRLMRYFMNNLFNLTSPTSGFTGGIKLNKTDKEDYFNFLTRKWEFLSKCHGDPGGLSQTTGIKKKKAHTHKKSNIKYWPPFLWLKTETPSTEGPSWWENLHLQKILLIARNSSQSVKKAVKKTIRTCNLLVCPLPPEIRLLSLISTKIPHKK